MKNLLLCFLLFTVPLFSTQTNDSNSLFIKAGIGGSYNLPVGTTSFKEIPGVSNCCNVFNKNSGNEMAFHLFAEKDLNNMFSLELRAGYRRISYKFVTNEFIGFAEYNKVPSPIDVNYRLNVDISTLTLSPGIKYQPFESLPLKLLAFLNMEFVGSSHYSQNEDLSDAAISKGFVYADTRSSSRNVSSGEIKDLSSFFAGISVGINYNYQFNQNFSIQPEIKYSQYFSKAIKNLDGTFSINHFSFGVNLVYSFYNDNFVTEKSETTIKEQESNEKINETAFEKLDNSRLEESLNIECYYLEFKICDTKSEADAILKKVRSVNFREALIDIQYSELLDKEFYIVKSNCDSYNTILKLREEILSTKVFDEIKISFIRNSK